MRGNGYAPRLSFSDHVGVGRFSAVGLGRQLRLVSGGEGTRAGGPSSPRKGDEASEGSDRGPSLAAYLVGLSCGSPCFCCGEQLVRAAAPARTTPGEGDMVRLECRSCGAWLEGVSGE